MLNALVRGSIRHRVVVLGLAAALVVVGAGRWGARRSMCFPSSRRRRSRSRPRRPGSRPSRSSSRSPSRSRTRSTASRASPRCGRSRFRGCPSSPPCSAERVDIYLARQALAERLGEVASASSGDRGAARAHAAHLVVQHRARRRHHFGLGHADGAAELRRLGAPATAARGARASPRWRSSAARSGSSRSSSIPSGSGSTGSGIAEASEAAARSTGVRGGGVIDSRTNGSPFARRGRASPGASGATVVRERDGNGAAARRSRRGWSRRRRPGSARAGSTASADWWSSSPASSAPTPRSWRRGWRPRSRGFGPTIAAAGLTLHPSLFRPSEFIDLALRNITTSLLLGAVLVAVVLLLFLADARAAAISLTAIPLSLLAAILALDYLGFGINTLTLGGLAIALGEVVDDAIIDVENIARRLRENRLRPEPRAGRARRARRLTRGPEQRGVRHVRRGAGFRPGAAPDRRAGRAVPAARPRLHPGDPGLARRGADGHPRADACAPRRREGRVAEAPVLGWLKGRYRAAAAVEPPPSGCGGRRGRGALPARRRPTCRTSAPRSFRSSARATTSSTCRRCPAPRSTSRCGWDSASPKRCAPTRESARSRSASGGPSCPRTPGARTTPSSRSSLVPLTGEAAETVEQDLRGLLGGLSRGELRHPWIPLGADRGDADRIDGGAGGAGVRGRPRQPRSRRAHRWPRRWPPSPVPRTFSTIPRRHARGRPCACGRATWPPSGSVPTRCSARWRWRPAV